MPSFSYRANIEGNQPLPMEISAGNPAFDLEEDEVKVEESDDEEDVPAQPTRSVVIDEKLSGYSVSEGKLAGDEKWDEIAELQSDSRYRLFSKPV